MLAAEYIYTTNTIAAAAASIAVLKSPGDGRLNSAVAEPPFLHALKAALLQREPAWTIEIQPARSAYDIRINTLKINLKITSTQSADNSVSKSAIYYSITGSDTYPYSSNWNEFWAHLQRAKANNAIKRVRAYATEYHFLVKDKTSGNALLKSIFDISKYISNASNSLQINWRHEFANIHYRVSDDEYLKKVCELLACVQTSVRDMIARTQAFAWADIGSLVVPMPTCSGSCSGSGSGSASCSQLQLQLQLQL